MLQRAHLCAELAAGLEPGTFGTRSVEFALSSLALAAAYVRRMLKTRGALGNVFCVLLNLIKRLIFIMFKDSSSRPMLMHVNYIHFFSIVHQLRLLHVLTFVPFPFLFD